MKKQIKMLPFLFVNAAAFYLMPFLISDTGSAMNVLLIFLPTICLLTSALFGVFNGFNWLYPVTIALIFIPTIFIFYNESAAFYTVVYGVIALVGNFLGRLFRKFQNK